MYNENEQAAKEIASVAKVVQEAANTERNQVQANVRSLGVVTVARFPNRRITNQKCGKPLWVFLRMLCPQEPPRMREVESEHAAMTFAASRTLK